MVNAIVQILLIVMILIQIIVLIHILYTNHQRYKQDKAFWEDIHKKEKQIYNNLKFTIDCIAEAEESMKSEQSNDISL